MTGPLLYQIRLTLDPDAAEAMRDGARPPGLSRLNGILAEHGAKLVSQYDAFAAYVSQADAGDPLAKWTRSVLNDPAKVAKYKAQFTVHAGGEEVYAKDAADALEAALAPLVDGILITDLTRHDTDPANNPQIPERFRG